ncbi:MAG: BMC domain-containing protein [Cyanobacteria bacterium P01_C01_bin.89]
MTENFSRSQKAKVHEGALGIVSTASFPAIVGTADMMLKSSGVTLVGFEKIGSGHCSAIVRGGIADVRIAVEAGAETAQNFGQLMGKTIISRPENNMEAIFPISRRFMEIAFDPRESPFANQAVGLLETRGFPAMVGAADAMLKAAEIQLSSYEATGEGLVTAIVRGSIANVAVAIEVGMMEAEKIGELHAMMVIPRALGDLEQTLPLAQHWLDEIAANRPIPVALPISIKQPEREEIALPELQSQEQAIARPLPELQAPEPVLEEIEDRSLEE